VLAQEALGALEFYKQITVGMEEHLLLEVEGCQFLLLLLLNMVVLVVEVAVQLQLLQTHIMEEALAADQMF
jgi:hypothetical protein